MTKLTNKRAGTCRAARLGRLVHVPIFAIGLPDAHRRVLLGSEEEIEVDREWRNPGEDSVSREQDTFCHMTISLFSVQCSLFMERGEPDLPFFSHQPFVKRCLRCPKMCSNNPSYGYRTHFMCYVESP
jgi:hypothetical protein